MTSCFEQLQQSMAETPSFDGKPATLVHLTNSNGMTVSFMDIGATWLSCVLPINGQPREVLLRSPNMDEHMQQSAFLGAIVGRYANRIAKGQFTLEGQAYQVGLNDGENSLHGGLDGFDKRRWMITEQDEQRVVFALHSPDGDQGYPGNLAVQVSYQLTEDNQVCIGYHAHCDRSCPVNLTNHAYFNLAGEGTTATGLEHTLQLNADYYLPTDAGLIPSGELKEVSGSSFDFMHSKRIGEAFLTDADQKLAGGYDHCFVFTPDVTDGKSIAAKLVAPNGDVSMTVKTTKPAIQFYSGNFLAGTLGVSREYGRYDGIALETQYFPDGPNHTAWESHYYKLLKVGDVYQHQTIYQFEF